MLREYIQFQLTSEVDAATPVFTLTCTYTGGPATTVSWQRDGVVVSGGTTVVTDLATATYTSTLTVTGRKTGNYCCVVANSRSTVISPMLPVQGEYYLYLLYLESGRAQHMCITPPLYFASPKLKCFRCP